MPDEIRPVTLDADRARLIAVLRNLAEEMEGPYPDPLFDVSVADIRACADLLAAEGNRCDAEMCECGHFHCRHHGIWRGSEQACDDCDCRCFIVVPSPPGGGR